MRRIYLKKSVRNKNYFPNIEARRKELRESPIPYKWLSEVIRYSDLLANQGLLDLVFEFRGILWYKYSHFLKLSDTIANIMRAGFG